ncbi:uncharacterized protein LOC142768442 [Rhipicephalus microplus]|uniref:uncharacterized protein LOC142768442 n=1 Tax=Rhipicephalus microplus TaxID=6941 RepID=UPI003F6D1A2B
MMAVLAKIHACFCMLYFCASISSSNVAGKNKVTPIGQNVSVNAYVYYDTTNQSMVNSSIKVYFEKLFSQVQQYFNTNHSIMINITVKNVTLRNFTVGYENEHFDYNKTLQDLLSYGKDLNLPNNSILYYYTWSTYMFSGTFMTTLGRAGQSDFETNNTFCTNETSGAVIRHNLTKDSFFTTAKATAVIFGSSSFLLLNSTADRDAMNKTFWRCSNSHSTDISVC